MKLTLSCLKKWVDYPSSESELAEQLTLAGLETTITPSELTPFSGIVVGEILSVAPHPKADRLSICQVACDTHAPKTIVCGAKNVRKGLKVATALIGAKLPNGFIIQSRPLRGIMSEGMLCSLSELGLESILTQEIDNPGIWELPDEFSIGVDLWKQLNLDEPILDIQIPPNRGDCLSTMGMAREIAILNALQFCSPSLPDVITTTEETLAVEVQHTVACPRYTGRIIQDINPYAQTPWWMLKRLWQGGIRSVNAVVDVTNYILLEWGAPLHAFDMEKLSGPLCVRSSHTGEKVHLLNDKVIELQQEALVIADQKNPVAIAGIMGGMTSAVTDQTHHIFLESAFFTPEYIASRARQYGLMTESSYRFERGVDPELCERALIEATHLLLTICSGKAGSITKVESLAKAPALAKISLDHSRINKLLGLELSETRVKEWLGRLGMQSTQSSHPGASSSATSENTIWHVTPPSWRFDIKAPVDLIEEFARLLGYDQIPAQLPVLPIRFQPIDPKQEALMKWRRFLADHSFYEAINYSFIAKRHQNALDPNTSPVILKNPISSELDVLRTQLWPGLLKTLQHNQNYQEKSYGFFEVGTVFIPQAHSITEQTHLAGVVAGTLLPEQWGSKEQKTDFFDIKQIVHNSLQLLDPTGSYTYVLNTHPALHPSQSSQLLKNGQAIGWLGSLHPNLYEHFGLTAPVYLFEWCLKVSSHKQSTRSFKAFSRLPSIRRDIAFWIDQTISFDSIKEVILKSAGEHLQDIRLFDVYSSKTHSSQRSLALGLIWQHHERTLTDMEVDVWQARVMQALETTWSIQRRSES